MRANAISESSVKRRAAHDLTRARTVPGATARDSEPRPKAPGGFFQVKNKGCCGVFRFHFFRCLNSPCLNGGGSRCAVCYCPRFAADPPDQRQAAKNLHGAGCPAAARLLAQRSAGKPRQMFKTFLPNFGADPSKIHSRNVVKPSRAAAAFTCRKATISDTPADFAARVISQSKTSISPGFDPNKISSFVIIKIE